MGLIEENFKLYDKVDDYTILFNGKEQRADITIIKKEEENCIIKIDATKKLGVYRKKFIEHLSPDKIDSRKFWKEAATKFPFVAICGFNPDIKTIDEANNSTRWLAHAIGALSPAKVIFDYNKKAKILEIGPGFGGFHQMIAKEYSDENYYAIDVNPLFNHSRLFQTDGKTIPNQIPNSLDMVYSINVFQHLSRNQRSAYYKQIYEILKPKGVFIFGSLVETPKNESWPVWGTKDYKGNNYVNFFRQFTPVDKEVNLISELWSLGFDVEPLCQISEIADKCHYLSYKCTKI